MFFLFGPLIQFDISERYFTCGYDVSYILGGISDFDIAVIFISFLICFWQVYEYSSSSTNFISPFFYSVESMVVALITEKNYNYFDIVNTLFSVIFLANFSGLLPYSQTITSQLLLTLTIALILMLGLWFHAIFFNKLFFWSHFLPSGSPLAITPFIILIELISNLSRIISLSVRLFANMTSGHALLKILSGFALVAGSLIGGWKLLIMFPVLIIIVITGLEILIAFLQTYVLVTLILIYASEQE